MRFFSLEKLSTVFYLALIVLFPTQLGKHFWPSFALVNGLRLDYLSPTIYVTDLLVTGLLLVSSWQIFIAIKNHELRVIHSASSGQENQEFNKRTIGILLILLFLVLGILMSKNPFAGWYGGIKLLEMVFFVFYTAHVLGKQISYKTVGVVFLCGMIGESSLALAQLFFHGSVGGIFYFLGERDFSMTTPGIANASIHGQLFLRPYATLPHPNVLAAFLLIGVIFSSGQFFLFSAKQRILFYFTLLFSVLAVLLTLSRTTILLGSILGVGFSIRYVFRNHFPKKMLFWGIGVMLCVTALFFFTPVAGRMVTSSFGEESVVVREDLAKNALWMIQTHPLFGVGLQNFYTNLPSSFSNRSYYTQMQPVHTIYLLVFAQTGIVVGLFFLYFLFKTAMVVWHAKPSMQKTPAKVLFISLLFLGLFDHYFLTLQQGQLLFSFVLGYCYSLQTPPVKKRKTKYNKSL